ncbi:sugar transferase [Dermacoccus nishinomiyaensis]|uniref:sugar transferase n=1 Tax=Dermacoccus nishinomiyaensis TaxID=1274 RepID=UPI0021A6DE06|nr:sugar transferase [Dermacoccus nishinomiyaensis]MCT1603728.1 sugar transferase [Dermacoccus nishinomiyaensis]
MRRQAVLKRAMDLTLTAPAFVVSLPVQAGIAVAVRAKLGSPVLFRQERPGRDGKPFTMIKFRTMLPVDESRGWVTDEQRMTSFGAFLRSTSLDELPTLWNIVKGDMSLVGPRPLLMAYLERYSPEQARRHEVRPGLTGLAQVNGRNAISWEEKFAYDVRYVDEHTWRMDLDILLKTVLGVVRREGISADGVVTMHEFLGTREDQAPPIPAHVAGSMAEQGNSMTVTG